MDEGRQQDSTGSAVPDGGCPMKRIKLDASVVEQTVALEDTPTPENGPSITEMVPDEKEIGDDSEDEGKDLPQ